MVFLPSEAAKRLKMITFWGQKTDFSSILKKFPGTPPGIVKNAIFEAAKGLEKSSFFPKSYEKRGSRIPGAPQNHDFSLFC